MKPIVEFDRISEHLIFWQGYDSSVCCDCGSCAALTKEGWVIFDPIPLADDAWSAICACAPIHAILLTSSNHQRDSLTLRDKFASSIYAPACSKEYVEADVWLKDGDIVAGFTLTELPGAAPGEGAYCNGEALVLGDALINIKNLELLPDKYCTDPKLLRSSLQKLTILDFDHVFFAHGIPLVSKAKEAISSVLCL